MNYRKLVTKWDLFQALAENGTAYVEVCTPVRSYYGILQGVTRESGGGRSFIVTLLMEYGGDPIRVCFRTAD